MRPLSSVFSRSTGAPIGLFLDNERRLCSVGPGPEKKTIKLQDAFWMSFWALFGVFFHPVTDNLKKLGYFGKGTIRIHSHTQTHVYIYIFILYV